MKKFWLILLALGLITAFSTQASAVDVKFSGDFYVAGMYLDKTDLRTDTTAHTGDGPSTAFFYQRLRLRTDFVVAPGLAFVTRADVMERVWGGKRATVATPAVADTASAQTGYENENIAFDWAYIQYDSSIVTFKVGYMDDLVWGTMFNDSATPKGVIGWNYIMGQWNFILKVIKTVDNSLTAINNTATNTDLDSDKYAAAVKYTWSTGEAGLLGAIYRDATKRHTDTGVPANSNYNAQYYGLLPYAKAQIGPVKIQAELDYIWGTWKDYESGVLADQKLENLGIFIDAVADFNMFYAGGTLAYISGDDPSTYKAEGSPVVSGGLDWNPCLIMFNQDRTYWQGTLSGYDSTSNASPISNAWFYQGRVGVRPTPKLDIMASVSFATADQRPYRDTGLNDHHGNDIMEANHGRDYGWEADVTATYKITNNLSYMLGAGYLWTGNYYKGITVTDNELNDNYMLINKLTLTF